VRLVRHNILDLLMEQTYRAQVIAFRLLGRRMIAVNQPELVREIFVVRQATYQRKSRLLEQALRPVIEDSVFINHGPDWAARRPVISAPLHPTTVPGHHALFVQAAEELAETWARAAGGPSRPIGTDLATTTVRIGMLATFGPDVPAEAARAIATDFIAYQDLVESLDLTALFGLPEWIPSFQRREALAGAARMRTLIGGLIASATANGPPGGWLAALAAARGEDGKPVLAGEALLNEVTMLLLAGAEGSGIALTWALYLAFADPPTLARLRAEADAVLGARSAPAPEDLPALPFTRAVVQEALRLYPPVAILARQATAPDRIRRWAVKPGTTVACVPWLLHRHPELWEAPDEFRPERFLPGAPKPPRYAFLPFGIGPRVCPGAAFGQAEMVVVLSSLVRRFDLAVAPGHAVMPRLRLTLREAAGMPMLVRTRGG